MRTVLYWVTLMTPAVVGIADAVAQTSAPLAIHSATLHADAGVITIAGTGLVGDLVVTVNGEAVAVLAGGTAMQIDVPAPALVLHTPGTYRLTVVDPVRQIGEAFVVASQPPTVGVGSAAFDGRLGVASGAAPAFNGSTAVGPPADTVRSYAGFTPMTVIEDSGSPYRTAIGYQALFSNSGSGLYNSASGYQALYSNTTGSNNTASGYQTLYSNTAGSNNTASGVNALHFNTTGSANTASGSSALALNTTGTYNTAIGFTALALNTTGSSNTASGSNALLFNTTGSNDTASGFDALRSNTTGFYNTASGMNALYNNTTGWFNTASGADALASNTTASYNTASGQNALHFSTTGGYNTASGVNALYSNTEGLSNTADGMNALYSNSVGGKNVALGFSAGYYAETGSYNLFLGADVFGTAADSNTIRIGLPYDSGTGVGQNQAFIAGIYGTALSGGARSVYIDANGQLGTAPQVPTGGFFLPTLQLQQQVRDQQNRLQDQQTTILQLQRQVRDQQSKDAELRTRIARLEALLPSASRK